MAELNIAHIANPIKLDGVNVTDGKLETTATTNVEVGSVTATDVTIKDAFHPERKLALSPDGSVHATLATALSQEYDSVDVGKMSKGGTTTVFNNLSATSTSSQVNCQGYNAVIVHVVITGTGTWKMDVLNATISNGVFVEAFDGQNQLTTGDVSSSRSVLLRGVTNFVKIKATEITDGATCTVKVQPLNV